MRMREFICSDKQTLWSYFTQRLISERNRSGSDWIQTPTISAEKVGGQVSSSKPSRQTRRCLYHVYKTICGLEQQGLCDGLCVCVCIFSSCSLNHSRAVSNAQTSKYVTGEHVHVCMNHDFSDRECCHDPESGKKNHIINMKLYDSNRNICQSLH